MYNSLLFFAITLLIHLIGGAADIISSLGLEKLRTADGRGLREGNTIFKGIWVGKDGTFAEKRAIAALSILIAIQVIVQFTVGGNIAFAVNFIAAGWGIQRAVAAQGNFTNRRKMAAKIAREKLILQNQGVEEYDNEG